MDRNAGAPQVTAARWIIATLALIGSNAAPAALLHVGAGCQYATLAEAVAAANTSAGADTIAIRSGTYVITATITVTDANALTIEGGYVSCSATTPTSESPTLDADTKTNSGAVIDHAGAGALTLHNLRIANNDNGSHGGLSNPAYEGGAIHSVNAGPLTLNNVELDHNYAANGAGIDIRGAGVVSRAQLTIADSLIQYNSADNDGGGISAQYADINIGGDTEITLNIAGAAGGGNGNGGGIYASNSNIAVKGHTTPGNQFLGSNTADYGGGLYLAETEADAMSGYDSYRVTMQNDRADQPLIVDNNTANFVGGGFYLRTSNTMHNLLTDVTLWNMIFRMNYALDGRGAALFIYADDGNSSFYSSTDVFMKQTDPGKTIPPPCVAGLACNVLDSNESSSSSSFDSIVHVDQGPTRTGAVYFELSRGRIRDNIAMWSLIRGDGEVRIVSSLIASNQITQSAMFAMDHNHLTIVNTTIADNTLQAGQSVAYYDSGYLSFLHNLVDQPFNHVCWPATPATPGPIVSDLGVTANTISTECVGPNVQQGDPAFVDPANADPLLRDFHLKINSQAKDRWFPSGSGNSYVPTFDLDGAARPYGSGPTPYDFGAYEYGASNDRIFNDGFDPLP